MGFFDRFKKKKDQNNKENSKVYVAGTTLPESEAQQPQPDTKTENIPAAQKPQNKLSPQEQTLFNMRKAVEFKALPAILASHGSTFIKDLEQRKEQVLTHIYAQLSAPEESPYTAEEFHVAEAQPVGKYQYIKIDMPQRGLHEPLSKAAYILYDEAYTDFQYYTVEASPEGDVLGSTTANGNHMSFGPLEEGKELTRIAELLG